jgi:hypothetical protein
MAKKIDPKAKAKRQKIIAGVGGVILLGVLAFQVPRTMKMLNPPTDSSSSSSAPAATTSATATPIAAPSLAGGNATAAPAAAPGGDGLSDPDAVPTPASGQLLAFGLFRSKDPFVQQLKVGATGASGPSGGTPVSSPKGVNGVVVKTVTSPARSSGSAAAGKSSGSSAPAPATPPAAVTTAVISVNGAPESVQAGGKFPAASPVFKLVSLTRTTARVGIAGGTLQSGAPTVTLRKNKPVTLLNTSDGTRYVLRLVSVS